MGKKDQFKHILAAALSLPEEVVLDLPLISLTGNEELKIENYKGTVEFGERTLKGKTTCGILEISGRRMALCEITSENVLVTGVIEKVGISL